MVNLEFVTGRNLLQGIHSELRICYKEAPAVNLNNTWGGQGLNVCIKVTDQTIF